MKKHLILPVAIFTLLSSLASAQTISIQFTTNTGGVPDHALASGTSAGVVPADNFNVIFNGGTGIALNDNSGAGSGATLALSSGFYFTGNSFPGSTGDSQLLSAGLNSAGGTSLSLAGIPYATYDVYLYGVSDNGGNDNGGTAALTTTYALTAGGVTQYLSLQPVTNSTTYLQSTSTYNGTGPIPATGFTANANYVEFTGLTSPTFSLVVSGVQASGGFNAALNGIQIVADASPTPEPSTWAMLLGGLGVLAFVVRRKSARI